MILNQFLQKSCYFLSPHFNFSYKNVKTVINVSSRLAGHSHWQNVKDTKDLKDRIKMENIRIITNLMQVAIKEGNNVRDPKLNLKLASVLERAKSLNIASSSVEKLLSSVEKVEPYILEFQARGGIFLLVESTNKHVIKEKMNIQSVVKNYGFKVVKSSVVRSIFTHNAVIICCSDENVLKSDDSALEVGLEVGANEVKSEVDPATKEITYEFFCDPYDLDKIRVGLIDKGVNIVDSCDYYDPIKKAEVNSTTISLMKEMEEKLYKNNEFIQRLFDNTVLIE